MNELQNNGSALEQRIKQLIKYMTIGLACLILVGIMSGFSFWKVNQEKQVAVQNQQVQAETTKESSWCTIYPDDEVCKMAREVAANPTQTLQPQDGKDGKDGKNGLDGIGVTTFDVSDKGNLIVNFTDGSSKDIGHIVGKNGLDGVNGKDGRGILSVTIDKGNLMIGFTDGVTENLGMVVGPAGAPGTNGVNGTNGTNGVDGKDGESIVGPTGPAGPEGQAGKDGISVIDLQVDPQGFVNVSYSDGTTRPAGQIIVNTVQKITCEGSTFTMTMVDGKTLSTIVDCTPDNSPIPPSNNNSIIP
jgi:hypothetical protein